MSLEKYKAQVVVGGETISSQYPAYKMDSTEPENHMRRDVELGTVHCCDFFMATNQAVVLLEETDLLKTVSRIEKEYRYLKGKDKGDIINKKIRDENQLKAYGSMLVLCRLSAKNTEVRKLCERRKFEFWLVAGKIEGEGREKYFDSLKDSLREDLTGVIGKQLLENVEVLSPDDLRKKISTKVPR